MNLQTLMQESQMYTPGPAMSLRTSAWLLPQKLHIVKLLALAISGHESAFSAPPSAGVSTLMSLRELTTVSTSPYSFASGALM